MSYLFLILGILIGFLFFQIFSGKYEGDKIERCVRFLINDYYVHIHHWIGAFVVLVTLIVFSFYNSFIYGFLIGSIIQGLKYRDRFYIVYHKDKFEKIYSKFKN